MLMADGSDVRRSAALTGCRVAIQHGNVLYVSPALYDLLTQDEGEARKHLLRHMRVACPAGDGPIDEEWLREHGEAFGRYRAGRGPRSCGITPPGRPA